MILRPVAFEYRSKVDATRWRDTWNWAFLISGAVPMIIYGTAFGNVLQDVGFHFGWDVQYYQDESFVGYLLNPFAILCGVLPLALSIHQAGPLMSVCSTSRYRNRPWSPCMSRCDRDRPRQPAWL